MRKLPLSPLVAAMSFLVSLGFEIAGIQSTKAAYVLWSLTVILAFVAIYQHAPKLIAPLPLTALKRVLIICLGSLIVPAALRILQLWPAVPYGKISVAVVFCASVVILYLLTAPKLNERIEALERDKANLKARWDGEVFLNRWLYAKRNTHGQSISSYVEVQKVYFCYQQLDRPLRQAVFGIDFLNKSVFDISIDKAVAGHIEFNGMTLKTTPCITHNPGTIGTGGEGKMTIQQQLTVPEADLIAATDPKYAEFNLENLIIAIKGEHLASDKPQHLRIPKRLHVDPQAEIDSLKAEIAALGQRQTEEIARLKSEYQAREIEVWKRAENINRLSRVMGYGMVIKDRCNQANMEYPKDVVDDWAKQLWRAIARCFGESDIEKFYSHISHECPGYERGPVRVIQVPESNAGRQLWVFYHLLRLSELITEQLNSPSTVHKGESQT